MRNFFFTLTASFFLVLSSITTLAAPIDNSDDTGTALNASYYPSIRNTCFTTVKVIVSINTTGSNWANTTFTLNPGETKSLGISKRRIVFFYAESIDATMKWEGNGQYIFNVSGKPVNFNSFYISGSSFTQDLTCPIEMLANTNSLLASGKGVGLFEDCNYRGQSSALTAGNYDWNKLGIANASLSSIKVPLGWSITLYENVGFTGANKTFGSGDVPCLVTDGLNDKVSSVIIKNTNPIGGSGPGSGPGSSSGSSHQIYIKNDCYLPIKVLLYKHNLSGTAWEFVGPYTIAPDEEFYADQTNNSNVYYYAYSEDMSSLRWGGNHPVKTDDYVATNPINGEKHNLRHVILASSFGKSILLINCPSEKAAYNKSLNMGKVDSGAGIGLFEGCGFSGSSSILPVGKYYNASSLGISSNKLASIKVPAGWSVTVYEYPNYVGKSETFTSDQSCFPFNWKDKVNSVEIKNANVVATVKPAVNNDETKKVSPPVNEKTEGISLDLVAGEPFIIPVSKELTPDDAWNRVMGVLSPNGFMRSDIDHKLQSIQSRWKAFPRLNNTLRVMIDISKSGTVENPEYALTFTVEESREKETSVYLDVKYSSTKMVPRECDKVLQDLQRKLGGN